jgi:hypothetical protein
MRCDMLQSRSLCLDTRHYSDGIAYVHKHPVPSLVECYRGSRDRVILGRGIAHLLQGSVLTHFEVDTTKTKLFVLDSTAFVTISFAR